MEIKVEIIGINKNFPECHESCPFDRECANHRTAGDFRTDGGMTPDMKFINGKFYCSKEEKESFGSLIIKNGNLIESYYEDPYWS